MVFLEKYPGIKAVVFDMDGTLIDNIPYHKESWFQLFRQFNIEIDKETFEAQNHGTGPEMVRGLFGADKSLEEATRIWNLKEEIYRDIYHEHLTEIGGLKQFLNYLHENGITMALATMGTKENIDFTLDGLGIRNFFSVITMGDEVLHGKPHPEVYLKALEKLNLTALECIAIEDSTAGIRSAVQAGLGVIAITTSSSKEYFEGINVPHVIDGFFELIA